MNNITFKIADTKELLLQSYQLVYKRYIDVGFCKKNENQIYFGFHDLLSETRTFIAEIDGKVIATLSAIQDNSAGLPCDHLFSGEVDNFRHPSKKIVEISRFAVSRDYKKYSIQIFQYLFQLIYHSNVMIGKVTDCIIMIEPRHCKVYKKFGFIEFSDIKLDVDANNAESKLMRLKLRENGAIVHYPCFDNVFNEIKGFLPVLNESLAKHQELSLMHDKFLSNNYLSEQEYKLFNFRGFLIKSYFHKSNVKLQQQKINNNWDINFFIQLKPQIVQLMSYCYRMANEINFSKVS